MDDLVAWANARMPPYPLALGLRFVAVEKTRLLAEVTVDESHGNGWGVMHGGALMAFADTMGAVGTILNLAPDSITTTLESKTNFIGPAPIGERLVGEATPVHRGRTTQIWTTRISRADGRLVAVVTQTQIVLPKK